MSKDVNHFLTLASFFIPILWRKKGLHQLFTITAVAFQSPIPDRKKTCLRATHRQATFHAQLCRYALFTINQAERYLGSGENMDTLRQRLYQGAYQWGRELRHHFHLRTPEEGMSLCRIFYRVIGIDFHFLFSGEILIEQCFFSAYYSPDVCSLISFLDQGLIEGICGNGEFYFIERITEGKPCCRARYVRGSNDE